MAKLSRNKKRVKKHITILKKVKGTKEKPRINVFKSLKNFEAQLINDVERKTIVQSSTLKLKLKNGSNIESATKLGDDFGQKLKKLGIKEAVFDRSGYVYHGRIKAFAEAVRKHGVKF